MDGNSIDVESVVDVKSVIDDISYAANKEADLIDRHANAHLERLERVNLRQASDLLVGAAAVLAANPPS